MQRKNWKEILLAFIIVILLTPFTSSESNGINEKNECRDVTYYNATVLIISTVYYVSYSETKIVLYEQRFTLSPFGIFYIADENGMQEFSYRGGYPNSIVTIYGFEGFFRELGWLVILMGKCNEINLFIGR